ncbi:MAG TPA: TspO/MBR family protein [Rhizomicrobium sp.]|nr:TspO/MBR family protein [Rhizomicrobium sp.]
MSFLDSAEDPEKAGRRAFKFFLVATLGTGALASLFTTPQIPTWYASLNKPSFTPPNWLFAPVWTTLSILMAFAAWRAWRKTGLKSPAMAAFAFQLALNLAWSVLFFGLHQIGAALTEILVLDVAIAVTLLLFFRPDFLAGLILLPYLAWTVFASILTHAIWQMN